MDIEGYEWDFFTSIGLGGDARIVSGKGRGNDQNRNLRAKTEKEDASLPSTSASSPFILLPHQLAFELHTDTDKDSSPS